MFCLRILKTALSRIAAAGLITILSASLATAQTPKTTPFIHDLKDEHLLTNLFKESGFGYSIRYPQDWTYTKPSQDTVIFGGKEGTEGYYSTVSIHNLASTAIGGKHINLDSVVDDLKNQLKKGAQNVTIYDEQPFIYVKERLKLEGREFKTEYLRQGENFKQWVIVIPRSNKEIFHAWFYTSPVNQYEKYLNVSRFVLSSWAIEDKTESTLEKPLHPVAEKEEGKKFVHPKMGFSLVIPKGWKEKEKKTADGEIELEAVEGQAEFFAKVYEPGNPDLMANIHHFEKENVGEGKLLQTKHRGHELIVDGEKAYAGIYEDRDGYIATKIIFVMKSARIYMLWGISRARELSMWESVFDRIVAGFRVTKPSIQAEKPTPTAKQPVEKELKTAEQLHDMGASLFISGRQNPDVREQAVQLLEEAVALDSDNSVYKLNLSDAYLDYRHEVAISLAIDIYEDILTREPMSDAVRARLADAYARIGNYEHGLSLAVDRIKFQGRVIPGAVMQISTLALEGGYIERGITELEKILRRFPGDSGTKLLLSSLYAESGRKARAISLVDEVIRSEPPDSPFGIEAREIRKRILQ